MLWFEVNNLLCEREIIVMVVLIKSHNGFTHIILSKPERILNHVRLPVERRQLGGRRVLGWDWSRLLLTDFLYLLLFHLLLYLFFDELVLAITFTI